MNSNHSKTLWLTIMCSALLSVFSSRLTAADESPHPAKASIQPDVRKVLTDEQWRELDRRAARALAWLSTQQQDDGSFLTYPTGQPAISALVVLAYMSYGHLPGHGKYGKAIERGLGYVLNKQYPDGLLARMYPDMPVDAGNPSHTASYNHAIAGLCLSEAYGMADEQTNRRLQAAIKSAISYTTRALPSPKRYAPDEGGWRYALRKSEPVDSDLSVTSWQLMFLRSCKNAGFDIPQNTMESALAFVRRCYDPNNGTFTYTLHGHDAGVTRGMVAAGILSLSLGGQHQSEQAMRAGDWLLRRPFDRFNVPMNNRERYFYSVFYASQAMYQLGGRHWSGFYPTMLRTLLPNQQPDGSWPPESAHVDQEFGSVYTTALALLSISAPYQLLPIFQR